MKRKTFAATILFSICFCAKAQFEPSAYVNSNWVNSVTIYEATTPQQYAYNLLGTAPLQTKQTTQYLDGLGRVVQKVSKQASPLGNDIVIPVYYDNLGRTPYNFLPFVSTQTAGGNENTNGGLFKLNPFQQQKAFYQQYLNGQGETFYYSQTEFESSPLNRTSKMFQTGNSWVGNNKYSSISYEYNNSDEEVHIWNLTLNNQMPVTSSTQIYATGELSKVISTDEEGKKTITYTDLTGNLILKKQQEKIGTDLSNTHLGWACTYYVYDDLNRLRYIITPKAVSYLENNWNITDDMVDQLCFKYVYDDRGRIIVKKQPGAGEVNMIYDTKDRLVFTQEANNNKNLNSNISTSKWLFNLYDEFDRLIATGLVDNNSDRPTLQNLVNNLPNTDMVTVSAFVGNSTFQPLLVNCPVAGFGTNDLLLANSNVVYNSITHFDLYDYQGVKPFNTTYSLAYTPPSMNTEIIQTSTRTFGFITGEKVRIIDNDNNNNNDQFIFSSAYYDNKGRKVQTLTTNIKGGTDYETSQFDFSGKLLSTFTSHYDGIETYTVISKNVYDKDGRLVDLYKNFNNSFDKQLAHYTYNELGQVKQKRLAPGYTASGKQEIESQNFDYNIHGAIIGINKDYALNTNNSAQWDHYFGMYLGFDNKDNLFTQPQLTGNITGTIWKSQGDNSVRKYDYTYDRLGRFRSALFMQKKRPSDNWTNSEIDFSVYVDYDDQNGNLKSLKQIGLLPGDNGIAVMDDLRYYYKPLSPGSSLTGNQLLRVDDNLSGLSSNNGILGDFRDHSGVAGTDDYDYDKNGNLTKDDNKDIAPNGIIYNYLNKPVKITLQGKSTIEYIYDAAGVKLTKKVTNLVTGTIIYTHYMGDFVYEETNSQLSLKYILHEEGRVKIINPVNLTTINTTQIINYGTTGFDLSGGRQGIFEYFVKDHLTNTRMVLTEEFQQETYRAFMESSYAGTEEQLFGSTTPGQNELANTRRNNSSADVSIPWIGNNTDFVKLSGTNGKAIGPNLLLKVMAGDIIKTRADYFFYNSNSSSCTNCNPFTTAINSLVSALSSSNAPNVTKVLINNVNSNLSNTIGDFAYFINNTQPNTGLQDKPKAFLNVIFFDEQFKFISSEGVSGDGTTTQRVSIAGGASFDLMMQRAPKNGWVYVYLSNESIEPAYFDNFWVTIDHERISEESHYYPHGLKIAGIASHAFNKLENKFGYQGSFSEEESETGYNEFSLRMYDPQIARWVSEDPFVRFPSPYIGMGNNPCNGVDPNGGDFLANNGTLTGTLLGFGVGVYLSFKTKNPVYAIAGVLIGAGAGYLISGDYGTAENRETALVERIAGVRIRIFDQYGNPSNVLPQIAYTLFNLEYGIKVTYQDELLKYAGDVDPGQPVSPTARSRMVEILQGKTDGQIIVGYNLGTSYLNPNTGVTQQGSVDYGTGWSNGSEFVIIIDLADFNENLSLRGVALPAGIQPRFLNLGRVVEHEFAHYLNNKMERSDPSESEAATEPGGPEQFHVNIVRKELNLESRATYWNVLPDGRTGFYLGNYSQSVPNTDPTLPPLPGYVPRVFIQMKIPKIISFWVDLNQVFKDFELMLIPDK